MNSVSAVEKRLSPEAAERLRKVYAPVAVAVPPEDARRSLVVTEEGEIRSYGRDCFLRSTDGGLTFTREAWDGCSLGPCVKIPGTSRWITVNSKDGKVFARYNETGPDGDYTEIPITEGQYGDIFHPCALTLPDGGTRLIACMNHTNDEGGGILRWNAALAISDDLGESWRVTHLPRVPEFEEAWPHAGKRWENSGSENHIAALPDGRLMVLARTSQDFFYAYYSEDGGDSWTAPEPTPFHGTLTTPYLLKLSDGSVVAFWNNTQPLPELDHHAQPFPSGEAQVNGTWEDVFTNRDACHAAVTEDGKNWRGFRELWLNEVRNQADFRSTEGASVGTSPKGHSSADKSVHQFQAVELPFGKILVHLGQNTASSRLVLFDVRWLTETSRKEDFLYGLGNVSTHLYVKSYPATTLYACGTSGHCAYNRVSGALLVPDPLEPEKGREVLQLCRIRDPRLVSDRQGLTWNFPASVSTGEEDRGELTLTLSIAGAGVILSLNDHWTNPCDESTPWGAKFAVKLDRTTLPPGACDSRLRYSIRWQGDYAVISVNGQEYRTIRAHNRTAAPLSYLHLLTLAEETDPLGTYLLEMEKH